MLTVQQTRRIESRTIIRTGEFVYAFAKFEQRNPWIPTKHLPTAPQKETLKEELSNILVEARMALPGMQGLFGFQTIAVFNARFTELPAELVWTHLGALSLNVVSIALMMTPAAYHRISQPGEVTRTIVRRYALLISSAMIPLAVSMAAEMFVIFSAALNSHVAGAVAALGALVVIVSLWFAWPLSSRTGPAAPDPLRNYHGV